MQLFFAVLFIFYIFAFNYYLVDSVQPFQRPVDDQFPWYAVRLFTFSHRGLEEFFQDHGVECFVPRQYVDFVDKEGKRQRELRPVVRNLFFVKKDRDEKFFRSVFQEAPFKMSVIRKSSDNSAYYEIPSHQMFEFRVMCNPEIQMRKFLSEEEAVLKVGTPVIVTHGPLKGLSGKLVRQSKKYFLLKEVPGMAVMMKVTRWCCKAME